MNTLFTSNIQIDNEEVSPYISTLSLLKERIKYMSEYGENILSIKIGHQLFVYSQIDQLSSALKKAINANELLLKMFEDKKAEILFKTICSSSKKLKTIEIEELDKISNDQVDLLKDLEQLENLNLQFVQIQNSKINERDFKYLCDSLPRFQSLQILKISIKYIDASSFFDSFKQIDQLKELHLDFEKQQLNLKRFQQFQKSLLQQNKLQTLMLSFITCVLSEKCIQGFFTAIKKASFDLLQFGFSAQVNAVDKLFSLIQQFIHTQKKLSFLQISGFLFKEKSLDPFNKILTTQKSLQSLTVDYYGNNLRNVSLSKLAQSISQQHNLRDLKILFDESVYSGESVIEFGEALKSLPELKDLRLEFPGRLKEDSVYEFSNLLSKCQQFNYLYIYFSKYREGNFLEFVAENPEQSIFQNKKLKISSQYCSNSSYSSGFYNPYLIQLVISKQFNNVEHLTFKQLSCQQADASFQVQVKEQIKFLVDKFTNLKSIAYSTNAYQYINEELYKLIQNNIKTLINVQLSNHIDEKLAKILFNQPNLLKLKFTPLFYQKADLDFYLKAFPKLISYNASNCLEGINLNQAICYFKSDALLENIGMGKNELHNFIYSYTTFNKRTLLFLNAYYKFIKDQLIYKQDLSHLDLWYDL